MEELRPLTKEIWICTKCKRKDKYKNMHHIMYSGIDWEQCPSCQNIAIPMCGSAFKQRKTRKDKESVDAADTESRELFDGEYYIEYVSADVVHLRRCR